MDQQLKEMFLAQVSNTSAIALYDKLCAQMGSQLNEGTQHIIGDICILEQFKQDLYKDIKERGSMAKFKQGRQEMLIINKSGPQIRQYMDQQRRLLGELKLTPASLSAAKPSKTGQPAGKDDFEQFDEGEDD